MQITITLQGPMAVAETIELRDWLHDARITELERITQEESPPKPGEQGPTLLAILSIILGSGALVELVRCIHRYIDARTPKIEIIVTCEEKSIKINCSNPPPLAILVEQAKVLLAKLR
jgi:hypothetical protein